MSDAEPEVLGAICRRVEALLLAIDEDLRLLGPAPASLPAFEAMGEPSRVASRAVLKTVEQLEDQLMRLFRAILQVRDVDLTTLFARDIADYMEKLDILSDAAEWMTIVKLRNRLVHDYPIERDAQFRRLGEALDALSPLRAAAKRALGYISEEGLDQ